MIRPFAAVSRDATQIRRRCQCGIIHHAPSLGKKLHPRMLYALLKTLHLLSVIVWVGGMVFVLFFLRPALAVLEVPKRLALMQAVLTRFFRAVMVAAGLSVLSGFWMMHRVAGQGAQIGVSSPMPVEWLVMAALGTLMVLIFGYVRVRCYPRLVAAVVAQDWPAGATALASIRRWVMLNLILGVVTVAITQAGVVG